MTIFEELTNIAALHGFKKKLPGQLDEAYLLELIETVGTKFTEAQWGMLSEESQEWYNSAVRARNKLQAVVNCPGYDNIETDRKSWNTQQPPEGKLPEKKPMTNKVPPTRKPGVIDAIRRIVVQNPDWTNQQVYDNVSATFTVKMETVAINTSDIKKTISIARELGKWNDGNKEVPANVAESGSGS